MNTDTDLTTLTNNFEQALKALTNHFFSQLEEKVPDSSFLSVSYRPGKKLDQIIYSLFHENDMACDFGIEGLQSVITKRKNQLADPKTKERLQEIAELEAKLAALKQS